MIKIKYNGETIITNVSLADNFIDRLMGYMFRPAPHYPGILFEPSNAIHTFFMRFSIDVIFMDSKYKVIKVYRNLKPWRHTWMHFRASKVIELPAGKFPSHIKEGDVLEVERV